MKYIMCNKYNNEIYICNKYNNKHLYIMCNKYNNKHLYIMKYIFVISIIINTSLGFEN
jgi:hypothetical protein